MAAGCCGGDSGSVSVERTGSFGGRAGAGGSVCQIRLPSGRGFGKGSVWKGRGSTSADGEHHKDHDLYSRAGAGGYAAGGDSVGAGGVAAKGASGNPGGAAVYYGRSSVCADAGIVQRRGGDDRGGSCRVGGGVCRTDEPEGGRDWMQEYTFCHAQRTGC